MSQLPNNILGLPSEAFGAIVAAIIAGLVAFFSLIISKEQSVSEFRQHWIDALREDVATVTSCVTGISESIITYPTGLQERRERMKPDITRLEGATARIRLRLNPDEKGKEEGPATRAVLKALTELEVAFNSGSFEFEKWDPIVTRLVTNSRIILKENWTRVRSGEPIYQRTKWVALILAVALIVVSAAAFLLRHT
jgi:hypothetical protein